jgi:hypothetical protein
MSLPLKSASRSRAPDFGHVFPKPSCNSRCIDIGHACFPRIRG